MEAKKVTLGEYTFYEINGMLFIEYDDFVFNAVSQMPLDDIVSTVRENGEWYVDIIIKNIFGNAVYSKLKELADTDNTSLVEEYPMLFEVVDDKLYRKKISFVPRYISSEYKKDLKAGKGTVRLDSFLIKLLKSKCPNVENFLMFMDKCKFQITDKGNVVVYRRVIRKKPFTAVKVNDEYVLVKRTEEGWYDFIDDNIVDTLVEMNKEVYAKRKKAKKRTSLVLTLNGNLIEPVNTDKNKPALTLAEVANDDRVCYTFSYNVKKENSGMLSNLIWIGKPVVIDSDYVDYSSATCSKGLHVATREFCDDNSVFGDSIIMCLINPEDIVSSPTEYEGKFRVGRYLPIADVTEGVPDNIEETIKSYEDILEETSWLK